MPEVTTLDVAAALFKMKFSELDSKNYEESELDEDITFKKKNNFERMFKESGKSSRRRGKSTQGSGRSDYARSRNKNGASKKRKKK